MPGVRIVVDTNIFVSALFSIRKNSDSLERFLFQKICSDTSAAPVLLISDPVLDEYEDVFYRPKFTFDPIEVDRMLEAIRRLGERVRPTIEIRLADPDDACFLECALDGKADYLITRNKRDFPDWAFIVTIREFMEFEYPEIFE